MPSSQREPKRDVGVNDRRSAIVWLLEHRNDHLPIDARSGSPVAAAGFVGGTDRAGRPVRWLSCPDCLTNGRAMAGCETCGGRGELSDSGPDPYAVAKVMPVGFDSTRHDVTHERDRKIEMLHRQTRPAPTEAELSLEANRRGYAWEEQRRAMYRRYDFAALDQSLDALRTHDSDTAHALNAVYVDGWLAEVGIITPLVERLCERGLRLLSACLPDDPLRAGPHPAVIRMRKKEARAA